jgi:beta-glucosidase
MRMVWDYVQLNRDSLLKEFRNHPKGKNFHPQLVEAFGMGSPNEGDMAVRAVLDDMPVYKVCAFSDGKFTEQMLNEVSNQVQ